MKSESQDSVISTYDVIVIGGGPAGSTAASLLSEKGWTVCVLEKDRHPRFHIGESLLPMNLPIFERLGVIEEIRRIGIKKNAAEFNARDTRRPVDIFYFGESLIDNPSHAYQVLRSDLDHLLLNNARTKGADVIEEVTVTQVDVYSRPKKVLAVDNRGETLRFECRFVIDASGRDAFLASKLKWKRRNRKHRSAAVFRHYRNAGRRSGEDAGNISIYWIDQGWIWMIPLPNDIMSIGAVCAPEYMKSRSSSLDEFLAQTLSQVPDIRERLKFAQPLGQALAAANYSYTARKIGGDGYLLIGDAFAFIDPVFSSGVYLAMRSAESGSELVDRVLRNPDQAIKALKQFEKKVHSYLGSFSWFIYRFNVFAMRQMLMHHPGANASQRFHQIKAAVIAVFSGQNARHQTLRIPLLLFKINFYTLTLINFCNRMAARAGFRIGGDEHKQSDR